MSITVEANLKIPRVKNPIKDEHGYPVDSGAVRFRKPVEVQAIPKSDDALQLETASGTILECTVTRADWDQDRELFVVSCSYAKRSMPPDEYTALVTDPSWVVKPLF